MPGGGEPARGAHRGQHLHRHRPVRVRQQRPQISPGERAEARPARGVYSNQDSMFSGFIIFAFNHFGLEIRLDWNKIAGK